MANEILQRDDNRITVLGGVTDDSNQFITQLRIDPATGRLKVSATGVTALGTGIENPTGTVDGNNTTFTVANTPVWVEVSGQVMVSQSQDATNYGYTYSAGTITFVNAPSQEPHSFYNAVSYSSISSLLVGDTGTTTSNQTVFTSSQNVGFLFSFIINGQEQMPTDYTFTGSNTFTLNTGVPSGLSYVIRYIHS